MLKLSFEEKGEEFIISSSLGLGLLAYAVFIMGLAGLFYRQAMIVLLTVLLFALRSDIKAVLQIWLAVRRAAFTEKRLSRIYVLLLAAAGVVVILSLVGALAPPTGHDSQSYRLAQIQIFIKEHRLIHIPYTRESLWPYLVEMLFSLGMLLHSDIVAKLIAWYFGVLLLLIVFYLAKRYHSWKAGVIAASLLLLTPSIFQQMAFAYVDLALAVYSVLFVVYSFRYVEERAVQWAAVAGIMCGFALSIKYVAVIVAVSGALAALFYAFRNRMPFKDILGGAIACLGCAVLFSFVWYLRSYLITGNPLYPFFGKLFKGMGWPRSAEDLIGVGFSLRDIVTLPSILLLDWRFGGENFGMGYLLFLPFVAVADKNKKTMAALILFILAYIFLWFRIVAVTNRFLFPVLCILSVLIAGGLIQHINKGWFSTVLKVLLVGLALFGIALAIYHNSDRIKVALGIEDKDNYLLRQERSYEVAKFIDNNLPQDATILMIGELHAYYLNRPYIHLHGFLCEHQRNPEELTAEELLSLMAKENIHYILYARVTGRPVEFSLEAVKGLEPIFSCTKKDKDASVYHYTVLAVKPS